MEIRQLEYFLMVSQTTSFTRAAERLFVSQPAVTSAVRSLESELGIQLFDRNQKQALLTAEGKLFHSHVEKLMHGISNTLEEIHAIKNLSGGTLHIGLTALGGLRPHAMLLKSFMESYPNIRLLFAEGRLEDLQDMLMADKLDLAFLWGEKTISGLTYERLARQELVACCGRQHHFRRKNSLELQEVAKEPLLLLMDSTYRELLHHASLPKEITIAAESGHVQTIKSLAAMNCGIAILPECLIESDDDLTAIPLEPKLELQPVLAYRAHHHLSHAATAFLELVGKEVEQHE